MHQGLTTLPCLWRLVVTALLALVSVAFVPPLITKPRPQTAYIVQDKIEAPTKLEPIPEGEEEEETAMTGEDMEANLVEQVEEPLLQIYREFTGSMV